MSENFDIHIQFFFVKLNHGTPLMVIYEVQVDRTWSGRCPEGEFHIMAGVLEWIEYRELAYNSHIGTLLQVHQMMV